jgi:hypothetical protein
MEQVLHPHPTRVPLGDVPDGPAHESVDRVTVLGLVQRQLMASSVELVGAVLDPIRPREQHLPSPRGAHLVSRVAVEELAIPRGVRTEPAAHLHHHRTLVSVGELDLFA